MSDQHIEILKQQLRLRIQYMTQTKKSWANNDHLPDPEYVTWLEYQLIQKNLKDKKDDAGIYAPGTK